MLEHTMRGRRRWKRLVGMEAITIDDQDLARLNLPLVRAPDQVQGAGFRADDERVPQSAKHQRPESARVTNGDEAVGGQQGEGEGPAHL